MRFIESGLLNFLGTVCITTFGYNRKENLAGYTLFKHNMYSHSARLYKVPATTHQSMIHDVYQEYYKSKIPNFP